MPDGIYIHIPFCESRCHYCAFYSEISREEHFEDYVDALLKEIKLYRKYFPMENISTLYFGGGTPSILPSKQINRIMDVCSNLFHLDADCEITLEANPGTIDMKKLKEYRSAGINRLSIGIQSFSDEMLRRIGRIHNAREAVRSVYDAHKSGFNNISADIMYGLPGQTTENFEKTLNKIVHLPLSHVSVYSLILEKGTYFYNLHERNRFHLPTELEEWKMYLAMCRVLPHYRFKRYEISNFAHKGKESRHNLKYWRYCEFIGFGAGATSFYRNKRRTNIGNIKKYKKLLEQDDQCFFTEESISEKVAVEEYTFMNLRLSEGILYADFERRFGASFRSYYKDTVDKMCELGLMKETAGGVVLTFRGAALANSVLTEFILE